ncbi:hypothetical protein P168DRAFT_140149 [Aspergillus campestris IBT 28561]|uniref:Transmembrane protein n=1 Tax=Aspergillus campestris (strain IBT 28561) TaxID=1392248 RepID=A0A2I1D4P3_ASPC2|nr:uncharacterized protein P168DRAFT_140149 [Aspergillus campestris IBT 28561]PKY04835.1 hypothetical protein P168DRAFT_140149 [Aspergillus campestris IBT 28561]
MEMEDLGQKEMQQVLGVTGIEFNGLIFIFTSYRVLSFFPSFLFPLFFSFVLSFYLSISLSYYSFLFLFSTLSTPVFHSSMDRCRTIGLCTLLRHACTSLIYFSLVRSP